MFLEVNEGLTSALKDSNLQSGFDLRMLKRNHSNIRGLHYQAGFQLIQLNSRLTLAFLYDHLYYVTMVTHAARLDQSGLLKALSPFLKMAQSSDPQNDSLVFFVFFK